MRKALLSLGLVVAMGTALIAPLPAAASAETEKNVDVYIIAGQSNAAGYSRLTDDNTAWRDYLTTQDVRNGQGYDNVLYYGAADVAATSSLPAVSLQSTKMGQGAQSDRVGPELGMANVLADRYTQDAPAAIVKFACGGTYLGDVDGTVSAGTNAKESQYYGTWSSPSVTEKAVAAGKTPCQYNGLLYTRLLDMVERGFAALEARGYTPSIKGYMWMQGEADIATGLASAYAENLKLFIEDLRSDVAKRVNDTDAENRPFVIGKIAPTFNHGWGEIETVRAAQAQVASELANVYAVETNDLIIYDSATGQVLGSDAWHFNARDMYTLGKRFALNAVNNLAKYTYRVEAGEGGSVEKNIYLSDGESVTVNYTALRGKQIDKVLLNDVDVTESALINGAITLTPQEGDRSYNTLSVTFKNAQSYRLTVNLGKGGRITSRTPSSNTVYAGDELVLVLSAESGYEVDCVKLNGETVAPREDGKYAAVLEGRDYTVDVSFKQVAEDQPPAGDDEDEAFPGWAIAIIVVGVAAVAAGAAVGVVLAKKKKSGKKNDETL